jgi:Methyltransferase domain
MKPHIYSDDFFDYIDKGARTSARRIVSIMQPWLQANSVVDFGSGRGVWLAEWQAAGCDVITGLDGDYVDRERLAIPATSFKPVDLTKPVDLGRKFDLSQSLEVGEHLPEKSASILVESMVTHSDRILFSAAVRGQGGEFHINEQPLSYWQALFGSHGYQAFDCLRPLLASDRTVEPWYRYNTLLYVNDARTKGLPDDVLAARVTGVVRDNGDLPWRLRKQIVSLLPRSAVTGIARARASIIGSRAKAR